VTTWTPEQPTTQPWTVRPAVDTRRITEDGALRITEQGDIRIIERFAAQWTKETTPSNPWTQE